MHKNYPWWKTSVFYQLYPRSFKDSNHDGIGDIRGIIEKIDYLVSLGIKAIWLNPVYQSPNDDMGYDISDYEDIMADFGTMEDLLELIELLHQHDIKLVMDLVVNHTSDEHAWFVEAKKSKDNPYRDYYIWRDNSDHRPPNNWSSFFTPSAWNLDDVTNSWYLHLFSPKQPDLNWEHKPLRDEIYQMINRWFDLGIDGFRMDVITLIAKKEGLPDGKHFINEQGFSNAFEHYALQPKMYDYLEELKHETKREHTLYLGEATFANRENAHTLVGKEKPMDLIFQFELMDIDSGSNKFEVKKVDYNRFKESLFTWQKILPWNTLFIGNHDQARSVSRFGNTSNVTYWKQSAKMLAAAIHLMKGTSFIYQGDEIGMTNIKFNNANDLKDIESINFYKEAVKVGRENEAWAGILHKARDHARSPIQWSNLPYAGFSTVDPWMMLNPNYTDINVHNQLEDKNSILNFYKKLIHLKQNNITLTVGEVHEIDFGIDQIMAYKRVFEDETIYIICNLGDQTHQIHGLNIQEVILSNMQDTNELIRPYEVIVYK